MAGTARTTGERGADGGLAPAFLALALGAVAMGISPIFVRLAAADGVGPFASAFWRVALALPALLAWARFEARAAGTARRPVRGPRFGAPALLAGLAFAGDLFFWHLAILNTTVANATFFATTAPVFVVLAVWLLLREPVAPATFLGLGLCCLGGAALIGQSLDVDPGRVTGDLYGVATAVFFAAYFLLIGRARAGGAGAAQVTFEASLVTAGVLLLVALLLDGPRFLPSTWGGAAALLAMALVSHVGGQGLLAIALGRLPAVFSSLVIFLEAVAAAGFGWVLLGEALTPVQAAGGALILAGIWVARPRAAAAGSVPGAAA